MKMRQETLFQNQSDEPGVCDATIRNWNRLEVSREERSVKLMSRANKQHSNKSFKPEEYTLDSTQSVIIDPLLYYPVCGTGQFLIERPDSDKTGLSCKNIVCRFEVGFNAFCLSQKFNALKVLRGNLEALPILEFRSSEKQVLLSLVAEFIETRNNHVPDEINNFVYRYFEISTSEIRYIVEELKKN